MYDLIGMWNSPTGIIIVLVIVLLLFGGQKIPEMMKGLGSGMREFKKGLNEDESADASTKDKDAGTEKK